MVIPSSIYSSHSRRGAYTTGYITNYSIIGASTTNLGYVSTINSYSYLMDLAFNKYSLSAFPSASSSVSPITTNSSTVSQWSVPK